MTATVSSAPQSTPPPGPTMSEAVQRLSTVREGSVPAFLLEIAQRYGPIASFRLPHKRYYLVSDPDTIKEILVTKARSFRKGRGTNAVHDLLGDGIFTSEAPAHAQQRRLVQPAFHRERIAGYAQTMVELTEVAAAQWQADTMIDVSAEMMRLTLAIGAQTLFTSSPADQADALARAFTEVTTAASVGIFGRLHDRLSVPAQQRFQNACARLHGIVDGLIAQRRASVGTHGDLLDMLLEARDEHGEGMSERRIRDEALTILLAAQESTAIALSWTWHLLATHPHAERRMHEELASVLGERAPALQDVGALTYTMAAFKEALRLFPPAWIISRRATEPVTVGTLALPRGAAVYMSPYVVHRSDRWYAEPDRFLPERWLEDSAPPKFAYFPFGGGARVCVGESFAWMEGVLVLATIGRRRKLQAPDQRAVELAPLLTLRPQKPIVLRAALRTQAAR